MLRLHPWIVLLCLQLFATAAVAQNTDERFQPLFDGKSFKGWEGNLDWFRIEDGAIVAGTLERAIPRNEFLCTEKRYGDFELRLKFKLLGEGANAGVQFRTERIPNHHEVRGYQADMGDGWWGSLYDESRRNKILAKADEKLIEKILKRDDWNEYRIRAVGPRIQLWINGEQTVDYTEPDDDIARTGIIAVQIHGGPPSEAWYKDIEIREIKAERDQQDNQKATSKQDEQRDAQNKEDGDGKQARLEYTLDNRGLRIAGVGPDNPIIYDNDWWFDTPDKDYLWAKANLGEADLRGNIVTRDLWDYNKGYLYTLEKGMEDAEKSLGIARRAGLRDIPDATPGADRVLERPASGQIDDTQPQRSPGSELIVAEARQASPEKPLVVFVGGPLNTVVNAYLTDPSIADRIVVFMTDLQGYNGKDKWANYIAAKRLKLVNFGARLWWPQRPETPVMPLARFDDLPKNELTNEIHRIAKMFWDRSTKRERPDRDDGFADGAPVFLVFDPQSWTDVQRQKVTGVFSLEDTDSDQFDVLDAREVDFKRMSDEFFRVMADERLYDEK